MKALVTAEFPDEGLAELAAMGYDPVHAGWGVTRHAMDGPALVAALDGAAILICEVEHVDAAVLAAARSVRLVATCRGDPSNVDLEAASELGITVIATPGRNAISVADFTLGLLLAHSRRISRSEAHMRTHGWHVASELPYFHFRGPELPGRTLGLVGLGAIGRLVAARALGFDMRVIAYDPYVDSVPPHIELVVLDDLLRRSDIVSVHCPLTSETRGLLGERELRLMRPEAILVNTARAAVVDEAALLAALADGSIGGAALDVYWEEPLAPDHPIRTLPNVSITPHVAGAADDVRRHHARMILDDIARWHAGEPLEHAVGLPSVQRLEPPAGPTDRSGPGRIPAGGET
jgi:phosphoglycerate dehydrogenase-like enzyme